MKIHALHGLDSPSASAFGLNANNAATTRVANGPWQTYISNTETSQVHGTLADGWFSANVKAAQYNFGNYRFRYSADLKEVVPNLGPTSNIYLGVRIKVGTGFTGSNVCQLASSVDVSNMILLFSLTDLPAYAINKAYYLEVNLNFATNRIERRVEGKPLASLAMPAWMATAVSATPGGTSVWFGVGAGQTGYSIQFNETHYFYWRDFYCVEWESGELPQFLGPQTCVKVPVDTVVAPGGVASTGTATTVLKAGYVGQPLATPTLTTDDAMSTVSITYDASSIPANAVLNGIAVKGRSAVSVNATGNLGVSLTVGGVETPDVTTPMVAAQTWYERLFSAPKTPSGLPWYQPNLANLTVKLKPKV